MKNNGHNALLNYIDDLIYCGLPSQIDEVNVYLFQLLQDIVLDISQKKLQPPDAEVFCLSILFNTKTPTISIPPSKLQEIVDFFVNLGIKNQPELQSLLGSLLYITK